MIAAFLPPFPMRGYRAPYLWVYYRLLASSSERMFFLAGRDYLRPADDWRAAQRWEMQDISQQRLGYCIPAADHALAHGYAFLADELFDHLLGDCGGNPVAAFKRVLTENIPALEDAFAAALAPQADRLEAILTWCNCPSLRAVAAELELPLLHLEVGPLRWPAYRQTAYLDFAGVNGGTEAAARFRRAGLDRLDLPLSSLRRFFATAPMPAATAPAAEFAAGVVLQVEDDSNLVAFGHGFDNQSLLVHAHLRHPEGGVLVRAHPGSLFAVKPDWYQVDASADAPTFVRRCARLLTINSSVGFEAMLMDVPVSVLGDCPFRHIGELPVAQRPAAIAFFLFAYLVPFDLIYDPGYLRFRLGAPSEAAIVRRHLEAYGVARLPAGDDVARLIEAAVADCT
jgi:hypothetical protein